MPIKTRDGINTEKPPGECSDGESFQLLWVSEVAVKLWGE